METKLNHIKLLFVFIFLTISNLSFGQGNETEQEWIQSYKELVYYDGLLKGLNDSGISKELVKIDNSFYNPVFLHLHGKAIKRGGDYLAELIKKDSVDRAGRVAEPATGKRALFVCLKFYSSAVLHKMAKKEYTLWMKTPNRQKLIDKAKTIY